MGQINPYWYTSVGTVVTTREKIVHSVLCWEQYKKKAPTKQNVKHKEKTAVLHGLIK